MRYFLFTMLASTVTLITSAQTSVALGQGYSCYTDSTSNTIYFSQAASDILLNIAIGKHSADTLKFVPPQVIHPILTGVTSYGFSKDYILAICKTNARPTHWIVNKAIKDFDLHTAKEDGDRISYPNVSKISAIKFKELQQELQVALRNPNWETP